jgi:hypothetical protein
MRPNNDTADNSAGSAIDLAGRLQMAALGSIRSRPEAANALLVAAASILVEDFGVIVGIEILQSAIDEAGAQWKAGLH